jgi:hypothetical protein
MLWNRKQQFIEEPFGLEEELEQALIESKEALFGSARIYLNVKRKIGARGGVNNIPDGYLLDLSSAREPRLYVVEVELQKHEPLKHIAVQILEFSLSFETSPQKVKDIIKTSLQNDPAAVVQCQAYAEKHGFENVDVLLEKLIYGSDKFSALVIIDELPDELETVLISRFKFPVEIITFSRYQSADGERLYEFKPFLEDVVGEIHIDSESAAKKAIDISDIDTIVVPAHEDGFNEVFIGENRWYQIRIHSSMLSSIRYIACYQVAPISAITHIAPVKSIQQWRDTNKFVLNFEMPATAIGPIKLVPRGKVKAPQGPRYTSKERLVSAKTMEDAF